MDGFLQIAAALGFLSTAAAPVSPGVVCAPRILLVRKLKIKYGETQLFIAATGKPTRLFELWGNIRTNTFTATLTNANGLMCVLSDGRILKILPPGEPA